jgi:hypothetical protein
LRGNGSISKGQVLDHIGRQVDGVGGEFVGGIRRVGVELQLVGLRGPGVRAAGRDGADLDLAFDGLLERVERDAADLFDDRGEAPRSPRPRPARVWR